MKTTRSISPKPKHHKSMKNITASQVSPKKKHQLSYMNAAETDRLVTRLTDSSQTRTEDYSDVLNKK